MKPSYRDLFFSTEGRISRSAFWAGVMVLFIFFAVFNIIVSSLLIVVIGAGLPFSPVTATLTTIALILGVFFLLSFPLLLKRLHDKDKDGKILILYYGLMIWFIFLIGDWPRDQGDNIQVSGGEALSIFGAVIIYGAFTLVGLYLLVICGFVPGTKGPNRFGPDPLAPPIEAPLASESD